MTDEPLRRLFVGTFLSDSQKAHLGEIRRSNDRLVADWQRKLRWVRPVKLHLTWLFLGEVKGTLVPEVESRLASMLSEQPGGRIIYDQAEFWPSPGKARQLVLTASVIPDPVANLGKTIRAGLSELAAKPDARDFRPHITLLRFGDSTAPAQTQSPRQRLKFPDWLDLRQFLPITQEIQSVVLLESHLGAGGEDYETLMTCALQLP